MLERWLPDVIKNPISIIGAGITTIAAGLFLFVFLADVFGIHTNPYIGMVFFLIMPALFLFGLVLIPIGAVRERRRREAGLSSEFTWPTLDLRNPRTRLVTLLVAFLTFINVLVLSLATYRGLEYMDSVAFCGQLCHEVMEPEFVAYQDGPHSRVKCVECHIGEGASWFVRSKLSGTRQIFAVAFNSFGRPVPSPVHNLRPARETCEQCHWPEKFHGDKIEVVKEFATDEANTMTETSLRLHVGGSGAAGRATGIHWHTNANNIIEYVATDEARQTIPYVRLTDGRTGVVKEFRSKDVAAGAVPAGEQRRMDCVDCHNRPTHAFATSVDRAINTAMADGVMPSNLPFIRREAATVLNATYATKNEALAGIEQGLRSFYERDFADLVQARAADLEYAIRGVQSVYARNVFPDMRVTFGTHPSNRGHMDSPGCFRCHDDEHRTSSGETISQDCELCHAID